eukprot:CAMPEP_0178923046 /NCGR_PEP_ID=MMETSP0786-20121207/16501_1 /TAXON_ID=186022 /ORGANISM="Thalassionema frauenfeldii, Strain CCMP 1798" /LENGTH=382 /DNA_ID=CAMNT_0020597497 /DNA_START=251 /DNA_END=1399 /DNA_ORIENTATION=-
MEDTRNSRRAELDALRQNQVTKRHNFDDSAVESASLMDWETKLRCSNKANRHYKNQSVKMLQEYKGDIQQLDVAAKGLKATTQTYPKEKPAPADESREEDATATYEEEAASQPICSPLDWEARLRSLQKADRQYKSQSSKIQQEYKGNAEQMDVVTTGVKATKISNSKPNKFSFDSKPNKFSFEARCDEPRSDKRRSDESHREENRCWTGEKVGRDTQEDDFVVFAQNRDFFEKQSVPRSPQRKPEKLRLNSGWEPLEVNVGSPRPKTDKSRNASGWEPMERNTIVMSHQKLSDHKVDAAKQKPLKSNRGVPEEKVKKPIPALNTAEDKALPQEECKGKEEKKGDSSETGKKNSRWEIFTRRKKTTKKKHLDKSRRSNSSDM